jgi:acyl-CoA thioester hydrolase
MPDPKRVIVPIQIRWRDLDPLGHVNNAVYLSYLEIIRIAYLHAVLPHGYEVDPETWLPRDFQFILGEVLIRYRSPAVLTDHLQAEVYVSRVGRKSFDLEYRITEQQTGRLIAEARSTQVCYDYAAGVSVPVPGAAIGYMETYQGVPIPRS